MLSHDLLKVHPSCPPRLYSPELADLVARLPRSSPAEQRKLAASVVQAAIQRLPLLGVTIQGLLADGISHFEPLLGQFKPL